MIFHHKYNVVDAIVQIFGVFKEIMNLCHGESGPLKTVDGVEAVYMDIGINPLIGFGAFYPGQQTHIFIVTKGGRGNIKFFPHFFNGVGIHDYHILSLEMMI